MEPDATPTPTARLEALDTAVRPEEYALGGAACSIGRSSDNDIVVNRATVSRVHARVERGGPRYVLTDVGSVNGTFVNQRLISAPHVLADRDLIGFGEMVPLLRFVDPDPTRAVMSRLRYDEPTMTFYLNKQRLELTPTQLRLLLHLYRRPGEVCSREQCAEAVWSHDYSPGMDADALDRLLSTLRTRLREACPDQDLIQTRRGLGFVLVQ